MSLRLLETTLPLADLDRIPQLLRDARVIQIWTTASPPDHGLLRVLINAQDVEGLSDLLMQHFGAQPDFRLMLLPVEATLPSVADSADKSPAASEAPTLSRISREEMYEDLANATRLTPVFAAMVTMSAVVAAVGLLRGDVAIIIGAMVIAPLLGPNIALSLATALGDVDLAKRSLRIIAVGVGITAALSLLLGVIFRVDPTVSEIASRTQPGPGDLALALAAGVAGSLAFTTGVPAVVVGVMVAVALLPPLVVAGLLAGGGHAGPAVGALLLTLINVTCINLAAVATFFAQKVRPRTWWETDRARRSTRLAATIWVLLLALLAMAMWWSHTRAQGGALQEPPAPRDAIAPLSPAG